MSEKTENLCESVSQSFDSSQGKTEEDKMQILNQPERKEVKYSWPYSENVKRDSFGFILRTDPLPLDKSKKESHDSLNNLDSGKEKSEKKSEKGKADDRYDDGKKSERERGRDRDREKHKDRDRSPLSYKRKYSRSPSPRRSRHRRSRSRSRSPRDPRLRRSVGSSSDRYRYRRYSSEKSPDKDSDKSDKKSSSPRRERSKSPSNRWRGSSHNRSNPVDSRNPPMSVNSRQDYVQMVPPPFHPPGVNPVPPPVTTPGTLPPIPEGNAFNRYPATTTASIPPQYSYGSGPANSGSEAYPGYGVYYPGYPPPPPPTHPPEYVQANVNNWQREPPSKVCSNSMQAEDTAKKEAIEKELMQQKLTLSKQREEYLRKGVTLNRELELLKSQKKELIGDKTRDSEKLLKVNNKLQLEINSKLKAVDNVIDILTGIIGDARPTIPFDEKPESGKTSGRESSKENEKSNFREKLEKKRSEKRSKDSSESAGPSSSDNSSSDSDSDYQKKRKNKKKKRRKSGAIDECLAPPGTELPASGLEPRKDDTKPLCNYIYYDPEMYWCQVCDEFPRTAKEYLNHLHSKEHKELTQEKKLNDMPWHELNLHEEVPFYEGAPTKRIPIKGLQFFVSATAWFCKLCRMWIGDLHCASLHLKSKDHLTNYSSFNEQNPHWETDWMANREKSYEKCAEKRRRQRDEELLQKQKQERMELMKKQEEELKQKFFSSLMKPESSESELIMPLTLPRSFENSTAPPKDNSEGNKDKEKKKKSKKDKKKKEKKVKEKKKKSKEKKFKKSSSSDSGTSTESSSETTDSEMEKKYKKELLADLERSKSVRSTIRKQEKSEDEKPTLTIPITLPEKSKWEIDDVVEPKPVPPPDRKETLEIKESFCKKELCDDKLTKDSMKTELGDEKESSRNAREKRKSKDRDRDWRKSDDDRSLRHDKKRSYRDKRVENSRRERRSSWDRKKDYRSSRYRRSRTRSRSRSKSRSREREKVTPGVIPAPLIDLFKLSDKHNSLTSDSNRCERFDDRPENDDGESKFEKQAMEAAKKKKIQPVVNLPKSKFGFIGRMPFAKKKTEEKGKKDDDSPKKEEGVELEAPPPPRITQPRPPSPKGPKPVLTNKTKVETAKEIVSKYQKAFQERIEESIAVDPIVVEMVNPPLPPSPPILTMMPPSPPKIRESPKSPKKSKKLPYPLPKDFQDALSIIYPEEKPEDKAEGYQNPEMLASALAYQQAAMGYGGQMMMYPGMHMMAAMPQMAPAPPHMMNMFNQTAPPPPTNDPSPQTPSPPAMPPPPENLFETSFGLGSSAGVSIPGLEEDKMETSSKVSDDDMALLGIDAEDMAAQQL